MSITRRPAYLKYEDSHGCRVYYFAPIDRASPPYEQVEVTAVLDIARDGTLAGVKLMSVSLPPPPGRRGPTQRELETLVRKLDRKMLVGWVEEMYFGKPAYNHLVACLRGTELTRHQRANALQALFRLRAHGSDMEVFALLRAHASDREIRVRTQAVTLLIGMMRQHNLQPP